MTSRMFSSPARMRGQPVDPEREPGVRRRPVAEGAQQEPEAGLGLGRRDPQRGEHLRLDVPAMDTHTPRPELPPVEHEVVGLGAHRQRVGRQQRQVLGIGHGERVVGRLGIAVGADALEHREVDDPDVAMRAPGRPAGAPIAMRSVPSTVQAVVYRPRRRGRGPPAAAFVCSRTRTHFLLRQVPCQGSVQRRAPRRRRPGTRPDRRRRPSWPVRSARRAASGEGGALGHHDRLDHGDETP